MTDRCRKNPDGPAKASSAPKTWVPFITGADLPDDLIERLCEVLCPPLLATVDMPTFVRLTGASHSLCAVEKLRVYDALPTLSQFQVDELTKVFAEEVSEFARLVDEEWQCIASLSAKNWLHLCLVADYLGVGYQDEATERKALMSMLKRKYGRSPGRKRWVASALGQSPLGDHVFSAFDDIAVRQRRQTTAAQLPETF